MADGDYVRLGCRGCGVPVQPTLNKDGSVRKNSVNACSMRCRRRVYAGINLRGPVVCACGSTVDANGAQRIHCSAACRLAHSQRRQSAARPEARTFEDRTCVQCGERYTPKHRVAIYCGKTCKCLAWKLARDPAYGSKQAARRASALAKQEAKQAAKQAKQAAKQAEADAARAARRRTCAQCGSSFEARSSIAKWCSDACRKAAPEQKIRKRIEKQIRRARLRNVHCERFADLEVFERDGWCCQVCGVKTPERLMGTNKPNAPTIDHIVAIANGGPHTRGNVQCACRACNSRKSDGPARGQMGLFNMDAGGGGVSRILAKSLLTGRQVSSSHYPGKTEAV